MKTLKHKTSIFNRILFLSLECFFTFVFLFLNFSVHSQKSPKEPTLPVEPTIGDSRNSRGKQKNRPERDWMKREKKIKAVFCDGREVEGFWKNPPFEFKFRHKK